MTIREFQKRLRNKEFSALETVQGIFKTIRERDRDIRAYLSLMENEAVRQAGDVDRMLAAGETLPPLAGVPLALKDNILVEGAPVTAASRMLQGYVAAYDARVVKQLRAQSAVFVGKTNLDEFAMGASTENSGFGATRNPLDTAYVPGGSSGGSAAAVAGDEAIAALGSDTGGSVRHPAAFCGIVGFRPTYGAVSRHGLIAMASSLDVIGPLGKTVDDVMQLFDVIRGADAFDATSIDVPGALPDAEAVRKLIVGIPKEYFSSEGGVHPEVVEAVLRAREHFERLGLATREVSLPHTKYAVATYYIVMPAEASSNLARYDGMRYGERADERELLSAYARAREGFGAEVKRRIILGTFVLSSGYYDAYYAQAQKVRQLIVADFERAFGSVDVLLAPVTAGGPFKFGEKSDDPLALYMEDAFTTPSALAGLPALALPVRGYKTKKGFPIGFQLIGRRTEDARVLALGNFYESNIPS